MTRPLTPIIRARWRHAVMYYQTELGLREWGEAVEREVWLGMHGFVLSPRDPYLIVGQFGVKGTHQITTPYAKLEDPSSASRLQIQAFTGDDEEALFQEVCAFLTSYMDQKT